MVTQTNCLIIVCCNNDIWFTKDALWSHFHQSLDLVPWRRTRRKIHLDYAFPFITSPHMLRFLSCLHRNSLWNTWKDTQAISEKHTGLTKYYFYSTSQTAVGHTANIFFFCNLSYTSHHFLRSCSSVASTAFSLISFLRIRGLKFNTILKIEHLNGYHWNKQPCCCLCLMCQRFSILYWHSILARLLTTARLNIKHNVNL